MAYTVIWYGTKGIVTKSIFDSEKIAKDHAIQMFSARDRFYRSKTEQVSFQHPSL